MVAMATGVIRLKGKRERSKVKFTTHTHTHMWTHPYVNTQHRAAIETEWRAVQGPASKVHVSFAFTTSPPRWIKQWKDKKKKHVCSCVPAPAWVYQFKPNTTFMFHYGLCMTTSICHLILFIIPAVALSDLCLPMSGFNTAECYIMIMSGLGSGMLSASHWGRMKWINIPEEAESGGLHVRESVCVCVCV